MKTKNEAFIPKKNEPRGTYILQALDEHFRNGDAYTTDDEAIHICMQAARGISYRQLRSDMDYLISIGKLVFEGILNVISLKFSTELCLRRPHLFALPEKMGKKRGARLRLVPAASDFR